MMEFYGRGSAQKGYRPGIIIQNNIGNKHSPNIVAIPLTSSLKNLDQPTHVLLPANSTGLRKDSIALCESLMSIPKESVGAYVLTIPKYFMGEIAKAFLFEHPVLCFLNENEMNSIREKTYSLIAEY